MQQLFNAVNHRFQGYFYMQTHESENQFMDLLLITGPWFKCIDTELACTKHQE